MLHSKPSLLIAICALMAGSLVAEDAAKPLTNVDVLAMVKGGLGESTIVTVIQSQDGEYNVSATTLLQLKKGGVTQKEMDAMLAASAKRKGAAEAASSPVAAPNAVPAAVPVAAPALGEPGIEIVQGASRQFIPAGHTQIVQTKTKVSTLSALASDGSLTQALTGVAQGLAQAGMMRPGSSLAPAAMMAMPMVAPLMMASSLLSHRKPTVTDVWAVPGEKSGMAIRQSQPSFGVHYANVPRINPEDFEPVLLKLESTPSNFRLVGATQAKQDELQLSAADWNMYSSFMEERVGVNAKKTSIGNYELQPAAPLAPGEYAIALRPVDKEKKFSGNSISQNMGDGLIFNSVWAFEVQQ